MADTTRKLPRSPRIWWELHLFVIALIVPTVAYPYASAFSPAVTPVGTYLVISGAGIALLLLSMFRDIGPTFVENAEARFQNRYATDIYSIPVTFTAKPTIVPGFSWLRATRADNSETIMPSKLRFNHSRRAA